MNHYKMLYKSMYTLGDDPSGQELAATDGDAPSGQELAATDGDAPSGQELAATDGDAPSGQELAATDGDAPSGQELAATDRSERVATDRTEHDDAVGFVGCSCDDSSLSTVFLPVRLLF